MAVVLTNITWWFRGGTNKKPNASNVNTINSTSETGLWELDNVKFPLVNKRMASSSRRTKRKFSSREERKIDKEYDVVLVPSDGGCVSGSESDDSDYSVGWLEPHGQGFQSDHDDLDDSFAVIVPCYGRGHVDLEDNSKGNLVNGLGNISDLLFDSEGKRYMEQWLSSLQNN